MEEFNEMNEESVLHEGDSVETDEVYVEEAEVPHGEEEWNPDYTFKVMDEEKSFDDWIKPVVNKENYDQIKDLYEKAYGLDHVKAKNSQLKNDVTRLNESEQKLNQQNQSLAYIGSLIQNKDWHNFFTELKIPEQEVMKYALDRVNYQDLSPEQKQEYDGNIESRQRLRTLEQQNQQFQQQLQNQQIQARSSEIDSYLNSPQYSNVVQDFDNRAGQPGSFRNELIRRGQMAYQATGQDPTTKQLVDEVVKLYGGQVNDGTVNPINQSQQQNVVQTSKPVIPNLRSGGSSPARKLPRSIEDLKKAAAAFGN